MTSAVVTTGATAGRTQSAASPAARGRLDGVVLGVSLGLAALGLVLVYSASSVFAARHYGDAEHLLLRQASWLLVGLVAMVVVMRVDGELLRRRAGWIFLVTVVLCALVLVPGIGKVAGGARRWIQLGAVGFQPSELAKLGVILMLAAVLARRDGRPEAERKSLLIPFLLVQLPVLLVLAEPDLGTALVIELIAAAMLFSAGLKTRTLVLCGLAGLPVVYHLVVGTPFRLQRLLSYIDPWAYRSTVGYQITESLISIGTGGLSGVGLGGGKHKLFFLPEAHTDFIFSILAEELGFVGVVLVLVAFAALLWRGVGLALRARTPFDAYLAVGLVALIGVPAAFNTCVATGLLPTKGLPLPLLSYGGSNLLVSLIGIAMLLRVGREARAVREAGES